MMGKQKKDPLFQGVLLYMRKDCVPCLFVKLTVGCVAYGYLYLAHCFGGG